MNNEYNAPTSLTDKQRADIADRLKKAGNKLGRSTIPKANREAGPLPLSFAQQRIWFLSALLPDNPYYNATYAYQLTGALDKDALRASLADLIQRHEVMRTSIKLHRNEPVQIIHAHKNIDLNYVNLLDLDIAQQAEKIKTVIQHEVETHLDIATDVFRLTLIATAKDNHVLVVTLHHIVTDGWSNGIFTRDLCAFYTARITGTPLQLPELVVQYADYAYWQRTAAFENINNRQLDYWRKALADAPQLLELPTDQKRPDVPSYTGAIARAQLDAPTTARLTLLSQQTGASLFTLLFATYALMIHRISGQADFVIGTPTANRTRQEIEPLIGVFVNALPIRVTFTDAMSIHDVIAQLQTRIIDALDNQDLPFERLVEEINPSRNINYSPLFQHTFALQETNSTSHTLPGLKIDIMELESHTVRYDIEAHTYLDNGHLNIAFLYDKALFTESTITRWVGYFKAAALKLVESPQQQLKHFNLLSASEFQQIVYGWNQTEASFPDICLHELIAQQARVTPDAIAIKSVDKVITYADFNRQADTLSAYLRISGVETAALIAVCQQRTPELMVSFLATLKAGAAYIPIDPNLPLERIKEILLDAKPVLLLVDEIVKEYLSPLAGDLDTAGTIVHCVTDYALSVTDARLPPRDAAPIAVTSHDLAYVIYTSGSTGKPKGVMVAHRGLVNYLNWCVKAYEIGRGEGSLVHLSIGFDATVTSLFAPLIAGKYVELVPEGKEWLTIRKSLESYNSHSFLKLTPAHLDLYCPNDTAIEKNISDGNTAVKNMGGVRFLIVGGEQLLGESLSEWQRMQPQARIINEYGPTETVVGCCVYEVPSHTQFAGPVPIGRPIDNTRLYILDAYQQPVPIGTPGELYIGGAGVAQGYLHDPLRTSSKFLASPFVANERIYRTGDLARYRTDGVIEYLGRIDNQVKIRGHRIELGDIESSLLTHPGIRACAAITQTINKEQLVVAYIVPQDTAQVIDVQPDEDKNPALPQEHKQVQKWQQVFSHSYSELEKTAATQVNFAGWNSSYTGGLIPEQEMSQWLDQTVARILAHQPKKVLELGCGAGLIVCQVAKQCEHYIATDFSASAIEYLERLKAADSRLQNVTLSHHDALNTFIHLQKNNPGTVDTIIINSVAQYFPDQDYLDSVFGHAIECVSPGGRIFVGDVRNYNLLEAFHTSVQLFQADAELDKNYVDRRIRNQINHEPELLLAPAYFTNLVEQHPDISRVEILPKVSPYENELTSFRYDAIIHINAHPQTEPVSGAYHIDWQTTPVTLTTVRKLSTAGLLDGLHLSNVLNAITERKLLSLVWLKEADDDVTVQEFQSFAGSYQAKGIAPHELLELAESAGYAVSISLSREKSGESFDAVFTAKKGNSQNPPENKQVMANALIENATGQDFHIAATTTWRTIEKYLLADSNKLQLTNNPLAAMRTQELISSIKLHVQKQLPEYMWPAYFVSTSSIPLTVNGKVNKAELPPVSEEKIISSRKFVAPETDTEKTLSAIWTSVLTVGKIGMLDDFFELGGNSLLSLRIVATIQDEFAIALSPKLLFENPSIGKLAAVIDQLLLAPDQPLPPAEAINLAQEVKANSQFNPARAEPAAEIDDMQSALLTGATGFLGAYLLAELLESTRLIIFCLVRSENKITALEKVIANLKAYGIWHPRYEKRIRAISGDLAKPFLGLSENLYEQLAIEIDIIYHNGAWVNFSYPYPVLKASNVDATKTIIQFACQFKQKPLHYISTVSVFPTSTNGKAVQEDDAIENWEELQGGYAQSKWVAEQLVHEAHRQGLPAAVYRPGTISGDSRTGNCNTTDLIYLIAKVCLRLKQVPDLIHHGRIGLVPVDYVAKAVVRLSLGDTPDERKSTPAFHLVAEQYSSIKSIYDFMLANGYDIALSPYVQWRDALEALIKEDKDPALLSLLALYPVQITDTPALEPTYDTSMTRKLLQNTDIQCPAVTDELLQVYLSYLQQVDFIPAVTAITRQETALDNI